MSFVIEKWLYKNSAWCCKHVQVLSVFLSQAASCFWLRKWSPNRESKWASSFADWFEQEPHQLRFPQKCSSGYTLYAGSVISAEMCQRHAHPTPRLGQLGSKGQIKQWLTVNLFKKKMLCFYMRIGSNISKITCSNKGSSVSFPLMLQRVLLQYRQLQSLAMYDWGF